MEAIHELVAAHPLFAGLPDDVVETVAGCARNAAFTPGTLLLAEGGEADTLFLVRRGRVAIEVHAPERGALVIETVGPGAVVGWSWLIPPWRWHFDARAVEEVGAVTLDATCLRSKAEADPALGYVLLQRITSVLLERLQSTRLRLLDLYGPPDHSHGTSR
ncbi:MAG TPA: cyclic nucleotide-binding domain-containing protein [Acidimicrobiales bacterium]|nr:cyclic nucleotide-binding domain-containing protein [Acidimicrobiales bacterium]